MPDSTYLTDLELLSRLKKGKQAAFAEIYQRFAPILHRFALSILNDSAQAQDSVHDVLLMLWERRETLEIHSSLSAYLYVATRNQVRKRIRHSHVEEAYLEALKQLPAITENSIDEQLHEKELAQRFEEELSLLPPKMREAFILSRKLEYSYQEISQKMSVSEHTVRNHISHALKILRTKLNTLLFFLL